MDIDEILSKDSQPYQRPSEKLFSNVELEDTFLDSGEETSPHVNMLDNKNPIWILFGIIIISLAGLISRSFYLQIIKGGHYEALAVENKVKLVYSKASRGIIYDQYNQPLVQNVPSFDLVLNSADFPKDQVGRDLIYAKLSQILEEPISMIEEYFKKVNFSLREAQIIKENIDHSRALALQSQTESLNGVKIEISATRNYIDSNYFSHILGYTGKLSQEEYEKDKGYLLNDIIGKSGIESVYEKDLRGEYGIDRLEIDSKGQVKRTLVGQKAQPGGTVVLTIDKELQKKLQDRLNEMLDQVKVKKATAVAMDPRDGSVRAMVSLPSYDNNLFSHSISQKDYQQLLNDPDKPLFNRAISGEYPPGSTFKPLMASAALQEKVITPDKKIDASSGKLVIPNPYNPSQPAVFNDWKAHGWVNLKQAIAQSSNVYFYTIGGGFGDMKGLGIDKIKKYAELFGLNKLTKIDLPHERAGLIPDAEWKMKNRNDKWYIGDTYNSSIGQGNVAATPLQLANYIAAIANGGTVYQPHLFSKLLNEQGEVTKEFQPIAASGDFISKANIRSVQEGMREAVLTGSGRLLNTLTGKNGKISAAGKTGTAQFKQDLTHAWFVTYAPYENPKLALVVLVEEGGEGHTAAVPVAKDVLEWYFNR